MQLMLVLIAASLCMGLAAALLFYYAVTRDWFRDVEDAKYQVFWSDLGETVDGKQEKHHGIKPKKRRRH